LDEPTNFLSLAGVQWLADLLLSDKKLTILMVTHDRAFLDEVGDRILELDNGSLYEHEGSYTSFLEAKDERLALQDQALAATKGKYKQELEWMRRQPQARQSKSKARIDAFYKLEKATKPRPLDANLMLDASDQRRIGTKIVSVRQIGEPQNVFVWVLRENTHIYMFSSSSLDAKCLSQVWRPSHVGRF
jgi:ATP-binding cassette subfamily F protein uup